MKRSLLTLLSLLLPVSLLAAEPPLQGQLWRTNLGRTGEFLTTGPQGKPSLKWKFKTGKAVKSSPIIVNGVVYIGSDDGHLYALDAATGELKWKYNAGKPVRSSPAVMNGTLFSICPAGVFALDAATGAEKWSLKQSLWDDSPIVIPGPMKLQDGSSIEGTVFYSQPWKGLVGLDSATGREVWRLRDTHGPGSKGNSAALHRGYLIYFRGSQATVLVNANTERLAYQIDGAVDNGVFTPAARNGICYSYIKGVVAFDIEENAKIKAKSWTDYKMKWRFNKEDDKDWDYQHPGTSSFSVDDKAVYFGHRDTHVYALDKQTGKPLWATKTGGVNRSSPALGSGPLLYIGSYDKTVYALNKTSGEIVWKFPTEGQIHSSPALDNGTLYIGSDDGHIYALQ